MYDLTLEFGQHTRRNNQTGKLILALPESTSYSNPHDQGWHFTPALLFMLRFCLGQACPCLVSAVTTTVSPHMQLLCFVWKILFSCSLYSLFLSPFPQWFPCFGRKWSDTDVPFRSDHSAVPQSLSLGLLQVTVLIPSTSKINSLVRIERRIHVSITRNNLECVS